MTTPIHRRGIRRPAGRRAEHGRVDHLGRRPASGAPVDPIYYWFLIPTLVLFTLAITVPAVIGIFYSFTNFDRVRRVGVHRADQLHRAVLRPGDPRRATCSPSASRS